MRAMVVYESMYGNTHKVAQALAAGLARFMSVDLVEVGSAPATLPVDLDLLLVGGPTHRFGLSRVSSRADAVTWARNGSIEPPPEAVAEARRLGLRDWFRTLAAKPQRRTPSVAFGTQLAHPRWLARMGTAADAIEHRLLWLGMPLAAPLQQFYVDGLVGPLVAGEEERATAWAANLAAEITGRSSDVLQRLAREHERILDWQRRSSGG